MTSPKFIEVDGIRWRLTGDYYKRHITIYLHRYIWEKHCGPIPEGYHVHHKDGNHLNNTIDNLECLSESEHHKKHWRDEYDRMYELTTANLVTYKRTKTHKKRMSQWSKEFWKNKKHEKCICKKCGKEFRSRMEKLAKWCSKKCCKAFHYNKSKL